MICRSCGHENLKSIMSFGHMPLANALLKTEDEAETLYLLDLAFCQNCSLVQITETVSPETLFRDYLYFSSFSDEMLRHSKELVERVIIERGLRPNGHSMVVEIASNDGYLLQYYNNVGIEVLGIEPAQNIAAVARERGITTIPEFFDEKLASKLGNCADVVHAHNVLAHVADLNGFVHGISLILKPAGVAIIEVPYVKHMIDHCEFDTVYHEHLCYFSVSSLYPLLKRHGLFIEKVECVPIHGGSLRLFVNKHMWDAPLLLRDEYRLRLDQWSYYANFKDKVEFVNRRLHSVLGQLKKQGKRIAAYGASAKGSTLLNYTGIGKETIDYVVDRSTYKQGRYMPGVRLPIYPTEKLVQDTPDYALLLTWNFAQEIMAQQAEYRKRGGKFIIPIPNVVVL